MPALHGKTAKKVFFFHGLAGRWSWIFDAFLPSVMRRGHQVYFRFSALHHQSLVNGTNRTGNNFLTFGSPFFLVTKTRF